jgi:hypothetical protein
MNANTFLALRTRTAIHIEHFQALGPGKVKKISITLQAVLA